jgi:hypothetical protein
MVDATAAVDAIRHDRGEGRPAGLGGTDMADDFDHHQAEITARLAERRVEQLARILPEEGARRTDGRETGTRPGT